MTDILWSNFHFLRPHVLWLMLPAVWLLYRWHRQSHGQDGWQQHCDPDLLAAMQVETGTTASRWRYLFWPVVLMAIVALAGPAVRQKDVPVVKSKAALIIALDVSRSMLADDLKPNRLSRAKFKIRDLLDTRKEGLTGLIAYSGNAFVVTPLTDDTETIVNLLDVLEPDIMPTTGTNTVAALEKARELLTQSGLNKGQVLLMTDDIKLHKSEDTLAALAANNIKTHVLAVGTAAGAPIQTKRGFVKDLRGQVVIPKVNFNQLKQAAAAGNGRFSVLSNQRNDMNIYDRNDDSESDGHDDDSSTAQNQFVDDGAWLLLLIVPLTALLYRRGLLLVMVLGFMLQPRVSYAFEWQDLWLNKNQQAYRNLSDNPELAQQLADNPRIKGTAAYRAEDYQQAIEQLNKLPQTDADDHYNLGNALAQSGQLQAALQQYDQALALKPDDEDTLFNKKLVEQALKQQQQQSDQQSDTSQDQQQNGEQQNNPQSEQQSSDSQQQENQDSQNQQNQNDQSEQQKAQESQQQKQQAQKDAATDNEQKTAEPSAEQQAAEEQNRDPQELSPEQKQQQAEEAKRLARQEALDAEEQQAIEQWLRRIQDDPGGLMRRKFLYQYHRHNPDGEAYDNQTTEDW